MVSSRTNKSVTGQMTGYMTQYKKVSPRVRASSQYSLWYALRWLNMCRLFLNDVAIPQQSYARCKSLPAEHDNMTVTLSARCHGRDRLAWGRNTNTCASYRISPKVRRAALNRVKAGQYRHSVPIAIFIHPPFCAVVAQMFSNTICYGMGEWEKGTMLFAWQWGYKGDWKRNARRLYRRSQGRKRERRRSAEARKTDSYIQGFGC